MTAVPSTTSTPVSGTPTAPGSIAQTFTNRPTTPFERDFLASVRLNYLHVLFLLRLVFMNSFAEPDASMVEISEAILELVVDVVLVRDRLANSGTNLSWKVTYYGLPAVGILLLAIVRRHKSSATTNDGTQSAPPPVNQSKVIRLLIVLVAELETGTLAKPDEPNYGLVSTATETIQGFLNSVQLMGGGPGGVSGRMDHASQPRHRNAAHQSRVVVEHPESAHGHASGPTERSHRGRYAKRARLQRDSGTNESRNHQERGQDDVRGTIEVHSQQVHQAQDIATNTAGSSIHPGGHDSAYQPTTTFSEQHAQSNGGEQNMQQQDPMLVSQFDLDTWDYEVGFWQSLADWSSVALDGNNNGGNGSGHGHNGGVVGGGGGLNF